MPTSLWLIWTPAGTRLRRVSRYSTVRYIKSNLHPQGQYFSSWFVSVIEMNPFLSGLTGQRACFRQGCQKLFLFDWWKTPLYSLPIHVLYVQLLSRPLCSCLITEAIPIPADQPIMQIKDLDEVVIPTMEIKVKNDKTSSLFNVTLDELLADNLAVHHRLERRFLFLYAQVKKSSFRSI